MIICIRMKTIHDSTNKKISRIHRISGRQGIQEENHSGSTGKNAKGQKIKTCSVEGCGRKHIAFGFCCGHYQRFKATGSPQAARAIGDKSGALNPKWRGGKSRMPDGRVLIFSPNHPHAGVAGKYVFRYRLVMEKELRRYLERDEIVHHKNGDCTDDRPENLEVMNQSAHACEHYKFRNKNKKGQIV